MALKHVLDNGATVLIDEMQDVRSFALGFFVRAGSGTSRRASGASPIFSSTSSSRGRGGARPSRSRGPSTGWAGTWMPSRPRSTRASTPTPSTPASASALDLLGDLVLFPAFDSADVEIERGVILEEIGEANDNPDDLVHEMFVRSFWKSHPLGAPILGTADTVRSIGLTDLYRYYRERYTPDNLIVSVAGHVRAGDVLAGGRTPLPAAQRPRSDLPERSSRRPRGHQNLQLKARRGLEQAHVCLGVEGPGQASGRRFATHLLDIILGGGMSSRLFQEVREKRGLVYNIASSLNSYRLGGYETIYAACAPKNLSRVLEVTLRELKKLKRDGVRPRELLLGQAEPQGEHAPGPGIHGLPRLAAGSAGVLLRPDRLAAEELISRSRPSPPMRSARRPSASSTAGSLPGGRRQRREAADLAAPELASAL